MISVLMPAFNASSTIQRAIASVQAQTVTDWEIIVVDDGSTDDTFGVSEILAASDQRIRINAIPHSGPAVARRACMALAKGEYFARLDADDEMLPTYFKRVLAEFERYPETGIVSTNGFQVWENGQRIPYYTMGKLAGACSLTLLDVLGGNQFGTSAVMTRAVYELTGGPRPEARSEDTDLWLRALALRVKHRHIPNHIFLYHQHPKTQFSGDTRKVWQSHCEIYEHLLSTFNLTQQERAAARRQIRRLRIKFACFWNVWAIPLRRLSSKKSSV